MTYALAYFVDGDPRIVGEFPSIEDAEQAASLVNFDRKRRGEPLVTAVVDRKTLTIQKQLN